MRGWLCRRKWKTIVQDYICSPHAESMRKRNQIVFNMVEAESEYVHQLYVLVNCFLRPLRMAASSKKPPISHDDVSSIFLNRYGTFCLLFAVSLTTSSHSASVYSSEIWHLFFFSDISNVIEVDHVSRSKRQGAVSDAVWNQLDLFASSHSISASARGRKGQVMPLGAVLIIFCHLSCFLLS